MPIIWSASLFVHEAQLILLPCGFHFEIRLLKKVKILFILDQRTLAGTFFPFWIKYSIAGFTHFSCQLCPLLSLINYILPIHFMIRIYCMGSPKRQRLGVGTKLCCLNGLVCQSIIYQSSRSRFKIRARPFWNLDGSNFQSGCVWTRIITWGFQLCC